MQIRESIQPIFNGISSVIKSKATLTKTLALPLAIYLVVTLLTQSSQQRFSVQLVGILLIFMTVVIASVRIHRTIILEPLPTTFAGSISIGAREGQYVLAFFIVFLCCFPSTVFLLIPNIGEHIATIASAYIFSRMSLMLPSVAVDAAMNAQASWHATKNYQLMMFSVVFLFSCLFSVLEWLMSQLRIPDMLIEVCSFIAIVFLVSALSEAYKTIMAQTESHASQPSHIEED